MNDGIGAFCFLFPRKQFCSCVRPVTLIYCVKMVTFFSFVRDQYKEGLFADCITLTVNFQWSVLYKLISSYYSVLYNAF